MTSAFSEYLTPIRKRLESLRGTIDQDLTGLEGAMIDLTLRQVTEMAMGIDAAAEHYKEAMRAYYRITRRGGRAQEQGGTGYYQRRREREGHITRLAQEAVDKQGYVVEGAIVSDTGYREATVSKVLQEFAGQQGWERRRDRETRSYRYAPKMVDQPEVSSGPSQS